MERNKEGRKRRQKGERGGGILDHFSLVWGEEPLFGFVPLDILRLKKESSVSWKGN